MNTLPVYPAFTDTFWSFKHALKFIHKRSAFLPLVLLTVAAMLPPSWPKRLIDINVTKLTEKDLTLAITFAIYGHHFRKVCEMHLL